MVKIKVYICPACGRPQNGWTRRWQGMFLKPACKHCSFIITTPLPKTTFTKSAFKQYMRELKSDYKKDDPSQQTL